ncbi:uncharacterized protein LOC133227545 isoform X3 [Bos javanicus]|uniref:uncharacterized protein LOC133227545 isoform X3 n=1 Tax=Bos javanicus TaxID=9906 RepID=UPI002AA6C8D8|nr:uncharacterized protein LOC133227545 isoform X3 [Bos javanicus]
MGNLNCLGGGLIQKAKRNIPRMSRTSRTSWMKRVCCWPHNRVHPLSDSTEELPEDHLEGLSVSRLEEEAPPNSIAREQASEHVPQEDMVVELPQDWAEDEPLRTVDESGEGCEHGKYSGIIILLRDNPTDKALQEHLVVELPQAGAKESPLRPLEAAGAANEHVPQEDRVVELPQDWAEDEPLRTMDESGEGCEHAPQEHLVVELPQAGAKESPLRPLEAAGAANEHDFTEDLPVNPPCDNTEQTQCFSKVALSGCESDCFVENLGSNDAEENAATPDECCPQTPRNCMVHIEDLEESKTIEIPKRSLVIFLKTASGEVSSDDEEDLEEQE